METSRINLDRLASGSSSATLDSDGSRRQPYERKLSDPAERKPTQQQMALRPRWGGGPSAARQVSLCKVKSHKNRTSWVSPVF